MKDILGKAEYSLQGAYNRCLTLLASSDNLPSEPELGAQLGVSRTTVRAVLTRLTETGLIAWDRREKTVLRPRRGGISFRPKETDSLSEIIERSFMSPDSGRWRAPGMQINELELAREIGIGTTSVREFLIRFSASGLIEKRPNSHWILKALPASLRWN